MKSPEEIWKRKKRGDTNNTFHVNNIRESEQGAFTHRRISSHIEDLGNKVINNPKSLKPFHSRNYSTKKRTTTNSCSTSACMTSRGASGQPHMQNTRNSQMRRSEVLERENKHLEGRVNELQEVITNYGAKIQSIEGHVQGKDQIISEYKERGDNLLGEIERLEAKLTKVQGDYREERLRKHNPVELLPDYSHSHHSSNISTNISARTSESPGTGRKQIALFRYIIYNSHIYIP